MMAIRLIFDNDKSTEKFQGFNARLGIGKLCWDNLELNRYLLAWQHMLI